MNCEASRKSRLSHSIQFFVTTSLIHGTVKPLLVMEPSSKHRLNQSWSQSLRLKSVFLAMHCRHLQTLDIDLCESDPFPQQEQVQWTQEFSNTTLKLTVVKCTPWPALLKVDANSSHGLRHVQTLHIDLCETEPFPQ